jgi:hypothetical protein
MRSVPARAVSTWVGRSTIADLVISRSELSAAARRNDALVAAGVPIDRLLADLNMEPRSLISVAEQRALRIALLHDGWTETELDVMGSMLRPQRVRLEEATRFWMPTFCALVIDGAALVRRAEQTYSSRA